MVNEILLDTNIIIPFLNGDTSIAKKVASLKLIQIPIIVLGELYYGASKSSLSGENIRKIDNLISLSRIFPIHESTTRCYGKLKSKLKTKGTPIPENDIWIAAIALEHGFSVATRASISN